MSLSFLIENKEKRIRGQDLQKRVETKTTPIGMHVTIIRLCFQVCMVRFPQRTVLSLSLLIED